MEIANIRISVIMGIYNCSRTLSEALDSLYDQTYKDFKIIMCDDASTDNTWQIANEYAQKYNNITLLRNEKNMKLAATLNRCLEFVDTEYVARMDGDDVSLPERFQTQIDFLDDHLEFAFVSSPMIYYDEKGDFKKGKSIDKPTKFDFVNNTPFCHAPAMIRKVAYDKVNGYTVHKNLIRGQDYDLWIKMYSNGLRGANIDKPLYKMRDDRNAFSRRKFKYRLNAMYVRSLSFKKLDLPFYYQIFALRPLIIALIPYKLYNFFRKNKRFVQY